MAANSDAISKLGAFSRRIAQYGKWLVAIAAAIWFSCFAYLRVTLCPTPRPEYWAAQIAELDPPGPDALTVAEAVKILLDDSWYPGATGSRYVYRPHEVEYLLDRKWDPNRPDIRYYDPAFRSDRFDSCRAAVKRVADLGIALQFAPGPNTGVEELLWAGQQWAKTLVAHSRWLRETTGDTTAVLDDWRTVLLLGRQLSRPHVLGTEQVRLSIEGYVAREVLLAASEMTASVSVRELAELMEELRPSPFRPSNYLNGNRLLESSLLEYRFVRQGGNWLDVSEAVFHFPDPYNNPPVKPMRGWNLFSPFFHDFEEAKRRVEWESAFILGIPNCADLDIDFRDYGGPGLLDGKAPWERGTANYVVRRGYETQTRLEAALTSLALAEFHRANGHYPESLSALVPTLLHHEPIDYGDGKPLRYRKNEKDSYVLYSIGVNGVDDGGTIGTRSSYFPDTFYITNPDAVFSSVVRKDR